MGHLSLTDVKHLTRIADGINPIVAEKLQNLEPMNKFCEDCLFSKQAKKHSHIPHQQDPTRREIVKGARLHSDLASGGNINQTVGGHKYCLSFIDDATDKTWIYILKRKLEVSTTCKKHFIILAAQGYQVKFFQTDNKQVYAGHPTQDICRELKIQ